MRAMLAKGFRLLFAVQALLLALWVLLWAPHFALVAVLGLLWGVLWHAVPLAWQFVLARRLAGRDGMPPPSVPVLVQAWAQELRLSFQVFGWRQPFRANAEPDWLPEGSTGNRRGVLLLHGYLCNRGFWAPWQRRLRNQGHPNMAISLEPVFGSIDDYATRIEAAVVRLTALTGQAPVVVCHSMGGLAVRAWLRAYGNHVVPRVARIITIGSPHHGTALAFSAPLLPTLLGRNARQMVPGSAWLRALAAFEQEKTANSAYRERFVCYFSDSDNIVMPPTTARLEGAANRHLPGRAHVALAFDAQLMDECFALIDSD